MFEIRIHNFSELHEALSRYRANYNWIFRGQTDIKWSLKPKSGRKCFLKFPDMSLLSAWKRRAIEYITISPVDDWDWLAVAQHHGLSTRLLDWTLNPLAAAFFAVYDDYGDDSVIYAYRYDSVVNPTKEIPQEIKGIKVFKPRGIASRISSQDATFTIHGPPTLAINDSKPSNCKLEKVIIDKSYRKHLLIELEHYRVTKLSLFPDLDGLSEYLNWWVKNKDNATTFEDNAF